MANKEHALIGLDLGSNKTCALVCYLSETGKLKVAGLGVAESRGWRKGVIVNLDAAVLAIKKAVEAAEAAANIPVDTAYVGVGGAHISGVNARGAVTVANRGHGVTREEIRQVIRTAQKVSLHADRELLHVLPQEFLLDSQDGIRDPLGMVGSRLEANVHLITASTLAWQNIVTAVNRAGIEIPDSGTIFEPLACAEACLTTDERELGVGLVDLGAGSSDLIVYQHGSVRHAASIPVGGDHFTNDIAVGLRTPIPEAEKIKRLWGKQDSGIPESAALEVPSVGERPARIVSYARLREIIEPRATELLEMIKVEMDRVDRESQLGAGLVLTGGGAKLGGLVAAAEQVLGLPVRIGSPMNMEGSEEVLPDPSYAAVVGLVAYGKRMQLLRDQRSKGLMGKLWGVLRGPGD
ncbi:MAG: cell division protein FtsA [Acidobacteria bacterium]|nr:cell division protein FtsA [Acidobacteriota bacterium]